MFGPLAESSFFAFFCIGPMCNRDIGPSYASEFGESVKMIMVMDTSYFFGYGSHSC